MKEVQALVSVNIGGHKITIEVLDIIIDSDGQSIYGQYLEAEGVIQISRKSGVLISQTLLHEIFHAIDHIYLNGKLDEDTVDGLSQGWWQILRNGDVFKALAGE